MSLAHLAQDDSKRDIDKDRRMLHEITVTADAGRAHGLELNVEQLCTLPTVERVEQICQGTSMRLETGACRGMGAGGLDGPRNVHTSSGKRPCRSSTAPTDSLADFVTVASLSGPAPVPSSRPPQGSCYGFDRCRLSQTVAARRPRQRRLSFWIRRGKVLWQHLKRGRCWSGARSVEVEMRGRTHFRERRLRRFVLRRSSPRWVLVGQSFLILRSWAGGDNRFRTTGDTCSQVFSMMTSLDLKPEPQSKQLAAQLTAR